MLLDSSFLFVNTRATISLFHLANESRLFLINSFQDTTGCRIKDRGVRVALDSQSSGIFQALGSLVFGTMVGGTVNYSMEVPPTDLSAFFLVSAALTLARATYQEGVISIKQRVLVKLAFLKASPPSVYAENFLFLAGKGLHKMLYKKEYSIHPICGTAIGFAAEESEKIP